VIGTLELAVTDPAEAEPGPPMQTDVARHHHALRCPVHDKINVEEPGRDRCICDLVGERYRMPEPGKDRPVVLAERPVHRQRPGQAGQPVADNISWRAGKTFRRLRHAVPPALLLGSPTLRPAAVITAPAWLCGTSHG
jgi:hypothetical protein